LDLLELHETEGRHQCQRGGQHANHSFRHGFLVSVPR
jgi:hypothetical protein